MTISDDAALADLDWPMIQKLFVEWCGRKNYDLQRFTKIAHGCGLCEFPYALCPQCSNGERPSGGYFGMMRCPSAGSDSKVTYQGVLREDMTDHLQNRMKHMEKHENHPQWKECPTYDLCNFEHE